MANTTISALPAIATATLNDVLPTDQGGVTYKVSNLQIWRLFGFNAGLLSPSNGGTGVNNGSSRLTLGSNFTTTGGFSGTLSFPSSSTYTFPSGSQTLAGLNGFTMGAVINMGGFNINNMADPTLAQDAATKAYVDSNIPSLPISLANGGTNANLTAANGAIPYSSASAITFLAPTATASLPLLSGSSTAPTWAAVSYPASLATNSIVYGSGTNAMGSIVTTNSATLTTGSGGIPQWVAPGDNALVSFQKGSPGIVLIPGRNRIVNGDFSIWQRGAGGSASLSVTQNSTKYTADRWQLMTGANQMSRVFQGFANSTGGTATVQRNATDTGIGIMRFCTSLTTDMCIGMAGNTCTLSFQASAGANFSSASSVLTATIYSGTGTNKSGINGAFTGNVTHSQNFTLTTSTQYFFFSAAIASNVTQLAVEFSFTPVGTAGAADTFTLSQVQLENSPNPTPFDQKSFSAELMDCQRFFNKTFNYSVIPNTNLGASFLAGALTSYSWAATTTGGLQGQWFFPTIMLTTPTIITYDPWASSVNWGSTSSISSFVPTVTAGTQSVVITSTSGTLVINDFWNIHVTADCDLT